VIPTSIKLSWATSSLDRRGLTALVLAIAGFSFGMVFSLAAGFSSPRVVLVCAGIVSATLIAMDFPGPGHARWSEFELSLPVPPRERARARWLLSLVTWLLPLLLGLCIARSLAGPAFALLPTLDNVSSVAAGVLLAAALRHTLGLYTFGLSTVVLRGVMIAIVLGGVLLPFRVVTVLALMAAAPLLAVAHRAAARAPEMRVANEDAEYAVAEYTASGAPALRVASELTGRGDATPEHAATERSAAQRTTVGQIALRYSVLSGYGMTMLIPALLWAFGVTSGWLSGAATHGVFLTLWVMNHMLWSTRLLRLGHLPYPRARLFRFVAWPALAAVAIGATLGVALPPADDLGHIEAKNGGVTLNAQERYFRLTTGQPPVVVAPDGESHQLSARTLGLGTALVAYDPYEVPSTASKAFLLHQLGRLLSDHRGLSLEPGQVEQRFLSGIDGHRRLNDQRFPEVRDPLGFRARIVTALVLILGSLAASFTVIYPGAAREAHRWRGNPGWSSVMLVFIAAQLLQLVPILTRTGVNPSVVALATIERPLAQHLPLVLPAAVALAVLLYRGLVRRFGQMEPPLRAKVWDTWFVEI
jgi:hypothetical protein